MKRTKYVTLVWIVAQLLHPIIWSMYASGRMWDDVSSIAGFIFLSTTFSLPAYFILLLLFSAIYNKHRNAGIKYLIILIVAESGVVFSIGFISFFTSFEYFFELMVFSIPALISVLISMVFTLPVFFNQFETHEINEYPE